MSSGRRRTACKVCHAAYHKARRAKLKAAGVPRVPSSTRVCKSCRLTLDITEQGHKCTGCLVRDKLRLAMADVPSRIGRPGCLVYGSVCKVLDEANERWVEMPVKHCKLCGLDQHLDECLDCTAPVGKGDKQKAIRALGHCVECGDWAASRRCPRCVK